MNSTKDWWQNVKNYHPLLSIVCLMLLSSQTVFAHDRDKNDNNEWRFHGITKNNNADASDITKINKNNVKKIEIYAIYNIDHAVNPPNDVRAENAMAGGIAVDKDGLIYLPTTDGRMHVIDSKQLDGTNADGTNKPKVLNVMDFVLDSRYTGGNADDGDDIYMNRLQPSLSGDTIFAARYNDFVGISPKQMGIPLPAYGYYPASKGAVLIAVNKNTGNLKWKTILDDNPHAMITNSPVVHNGVVYAALSSEMSGTSSVPFFGFGNFSANFDPFLVPGDPTSKSGLMYRNALVALDLKTGAILWKTYVVPEQSYRSPATIVAEDNAGIWSGGSSWGGGNFPIDEKRKQIYIGTGQVYFAPKAALDCEVARLSTPGADPFGGSECLNFNQDGTPIVEGIKNVPSSIPGVTSSNIPLASSVVAFDYTTGKIKWSKPLVGFDVWNLSCIGNLFFGQPVNQMLCPSYIRAGSPFYGLNFFAKDLDVGEQPMYVNKVKMGRGEVRDLLIATNKKADIWALDPDSGDAVWGPVSFGPGSLFGGGILWGSATDGKRIYTKSTTGSITASTVNDPANKVVPGSCPAEAFNGQTGALMGGVYAAVNLKDGSVAWQRCMVGTAVDSTTGMPILDSAGQPKQVAGFYEGPLTYANGMVVVGLSNVYAFFPGTQLLAEFIALDAKTGEILKRMPLNAPGKPSAMFAQYQRPTIINDMIILGNGQKNNVTSPLDRRLVIYKLPNKSDRDNDAYQEEDDD